MIRRLLTLIALCAGFAAIGAPARAAQVVLAAEQVASNSAIAAPVHDVRLTGAAPQVRVAGWQTPDRPTAIAAHPAPAVRLQTDRARE
ncbi:hypothetical protein V5740_05390 [Croceibacterium sp. TMG7-5b_MA50]|uniref:hypothetical protein n=1 Tax=Croceibacterium sp. TMG7-5b_MA50 TaxID=3121290 RepID=UPI003221D63B